MNQQNQEVGLRKHRGRGNKTYLCSVSTLHTFRLSTEYISRLQSMDWSPAKDGECVGRRTDKGMWLTHAALGPLAARIRALVYCGKCN
ncbi:hypothetical protein DNTS_006744 [Danionella cerebrum]|uniref:Uncharacterized protein n=1 Tax=Danionella cerebrum TaxID=2873325 RepID=A0A553QZ98_9TELE|nr:hypothetical protein DNTS_006744 [Danionella translucida]